MSTFDFFIDTADTEYIKRKWDEVNKVVDLNNYKGITTNPSAFAKEGLTTIAEWEKRTRELCLLVEEQTTKKNVVVYVQMPSDSLSYTQTKRWASMISGWGTDKVQVGLKIPPYYSHMAKELLHLIPKINVTGLAEHGTLLRCAAVGGISHLSIIPGRMEAADIDAKAQVAYIVQNLPAHTKPKVITGAMRTLEGLKWCAEFHTVPTIGKRVLDLINKDNAEEVFNPVLRNNFLDLDSQYVPLIEQRNIDLSVSFFKEMNKCSEQVATEFDKEQ